MSSESVEQLGRAIQALIQLTEESDAHWQALSALAQEHEERIRAHEQLFHMHEMQLKAFLDSLARFERQSIERERESLKRESEFRAQFQAMMEESRSVHKRMEAHERRSDELWGSLREHERRVKESLALLTQIQAEIVRLDTLS